MLNNKHQKLLKCVQLKHNQLEQTLKNKTFETLFVKKLLIILINKHQNTLNIFLQDITHLKKKIKTL